MNNISKNNLKRKIKLETTISDDEKSIKKVKLETTTSTSLNNKNKNINSIKKERINKTDIKDNKENIIKNNDIEEPLWENYLLLSEQQNLDLNVAKNITDLFQQGNTIPFIARYRRHVTGNLSPEILREIKEEYDNICELRVKITSSIKTLKKNDDISDDVKKAILSSRTIEELEYVYAPYKTGNKRTLAGRAKQLGLEEPSLQLLENKPVNLSQFIQNDKKKLGITKIEEGVKHIIASIISTDVELLTFLRNLRHDTNFMIHVKKSNSKLKIEKNTEKFEFYYNFSISNKLIKPHQILAINRGESQKILCIKIDIPEFIFKKFKQFCENKWLNKGVFNEIRWRIINNAIDDSYNRLIQPLIIREIKTELKLKANRSSCDVFTTNLKQLLLMTPLKGKSILGIDPGFNNGCKLALVSCTGDLLDYNVIYPFKNDDKNQHAILLKNLLIKHNCELIALGNGKACRETETWLNDLIIKKFFTPLDVKYTIVNEDGASIYSCSTEAQKEFPNLDPNIISAVSLARRIQEPMAELVKIEPRHLGVGMYQHDIKKKQLEEILEMTISECVSFVGVDLNTASQCLLKYVAGLSDKKAQQIIDYRCKNGPFICRKDLCNIKGIGEKIFQQCAGFLRVGPIDKNTIMNFYVNPKTTKLDCTYIHPESYKITKKLLKILNLNEINIGDDNFINSIKIKLSSLDFKQLSQELDSKEEIIKFILETLSKPLNYDLRNECPQRPLFRKSLTNIESLRCGSFLTGRVNNVTHFGCFVDIGVGCNGLIHTSKLNGIQLKIGDIVEVKVINIIIDKKRICLQLIKKQ